MSRFLFETHRLDLDIDAEHRLTNIAAPRRRAHRLTPFSNAAKASSISAMKSALSFATHAIAAGAMAPSAADA